MRTARLVLTRLAGIVFAILVIAVINFCLVRAAPGDPAMVIAGQSGSTDEKFLAQVRADYGLDQPYAVQLGTYLKKIVTLDLGYSFRQGRPVSDLILERLGPTLLLTLSAFFISLIGGVVFGALAGLRHGKITDLGISLAALVLYATPVFWLGLMLVLLFSIKLEWLPAFGYADMRAKSFGTVGYALDVLKHLILPALTLAAIYMAAYTRLMRAALIEVAAEDHVKTARAKGLSEGAILGNGVLVAGPRASDIRRGDRAGLPGASGPLPRDVDSRDRGEPPDRPDPPAGGPTARGALSRRKTNEQDIENLPQPPGRGCRAHAPCRRLPDGRAGAGYLPRLALGHGRCALHAPGPESHAHGQ